MIIKYTNFSNGIHNVSFSEPVEKLGLENLFSGNVDVECRMDKSLHQIVLNCDLSVKSEARCDRCNTQFEEKLSSHFQLSYLFTNKPEGSEELNIKFLTPDEDKIDISNDVIEYAKLSIPLKRICKEDCKGLCPNCGTNLNEKQCDCRTDKNLDVWEPLKKIKFNN